MKGITLIQTVPVAQKDSRGATFELFKGLSGQQITFGKRRQGTVFAGYFHKGLDKSKDPEYFFLVGGLVEISSNNGLTGETLHQEVSEGKLVVIEKNIYHQFKALIDVVFIEYSATVFDQENSDCFPKDQYVAYIQSLL